MPTSCSPSGGLLRPSPSPVKLLAALLLLLLCLQEQAVAQNSEVERVCGRNPFLALKQIAEQILRRPLTGAEFNILFNRALNDPEKGPDLRRMVTRYQECSLGVENGHF